MSKLTWTILLVLSAAGIASFYPFVKVLGGEEPLLIAFLRCSIAALALLPIILYGRGFSLPAAREWPLFIFLGACVAFPTMFLAAGIAHTSSVLGAILMNTQPLLIALFSPYLISERTGNTKLIAIGIGFVGVVLVILNGEGLDILLDHTYVLGVALVTTGAIISSLNKMYSKGPVRRYDGLYVTFCSVALGSLMLAFTLVLTGNLSDLFTLDSREWLAGAGIGILATAIPWAVWASSLKHLDVHVAATFNLLIPPFAAIYAFLFLQEEFTLWMLTGMLLTSAGIYLVQREQAPAPVHQ